METNNKGSTLPQEYWIKRPEDKKMEFVKLFNEKYGIDSSSRIGGTCVFYRIEDESYHSGRCQDPPPKDNLPILLYEEWKSAILGEPSESKSQTLEQVVYKVGDWIWPLTESGKGKKSYGHGRHTGRAYRRWQIDPKAGWVRMETHDGKQCNGDGAIHKDDVRLATQEEIAIAQGKSTTVEDYRSSVIDGKQVAIECKSQQEWDDVLAVLTANGNRTTLTSSSYKTYADKGACLGLQSKSWAATAYKAWYIENNHKIITAEAFLKANGQPVEKSGYSVEDWVTILDTSGVRGWSSGHKWIGKTVQLTNEKYIGYLNDEEGKPVILDKENAIGINFRSTDIRPATQAEIQQATGKVEDTSGWKIGETISNELLSTPNKVFYDTSGTKAYNDSWMTDKKVLEVKNGWAKISGCNAELWIVPKSTVQQPVDTVSKTQDSRCTGWQVGDNFRCGNSIIYEMSKIIGDNVKITWPGNEMSYQIKTVNDYVKSGSWTIVKDTKQESSNNQQSSITNQKQQNNECRQPSSGSTGKDSGLQQGHIFGNSEEPAFKRGNRKPGSAGQGGGQSLAVIRGHKRNGKVFKGSEESSCWPS